ncbi:hypothetical protein RRG08_038743 [Elysia crispata]|uniref:Uncharacterized protein n=1 Tax=Elysia crispata TaxID=231223 RepID=A0AAE1CQ55_9GAST|nr:hypothetical protein RRG08_038743 [Elysia crispata]
MPRSRFLSVLSFSHLNNNETQVPRGRENHDPLHKIRSFFNHLKQTFQHSTSFNKTNASTEHFALDVDAPSLESACQESLSSGK